MSEPTETPRRRRRPPPQTPPPSQGSAAKGVILVVVAVFVGFALLQDQDSSTAQVGVGAEDDPVDTAVGDDDDPIDDTTSSTTEPPRPPSEVKVLVANGSGTTGAAGTQSDALEALGYVTGNPTNTERVPETVVYFEPGYQAEAEVLAEALGLEPSAAQPIPTPAPVPDMQLANLLVVVGPDIATAG